MSFTMPEKPLLLFPSLARKLGVDAAILLSQCQELLSSPAAAQTRDAKGISIREITLSRHQWLQVTEFWDLNRVNELVSTLVQHQCLNVAIASDGRVRIANVGTLPEHTESDDVQQHDAADVVSAPVSLASYSQNLVDSAPATTELPVYNQPPPMPRRPLPSKSANAVMRDRGPAPVFGGSIGWKRQKDDSQQDRLQQLFEQHEERNQKLHLMFLGWTPSELFYSMLPRHQIPRDFVDTCIDEFILYYIDKERKESNWDQKFLAWIKREWVQKQTRESRAQRKEQSFSGSKNEDTRRDSKENRKRVTAAIMDIKDTDW